MFTRCRQRSLYQTWIIHNFTSMDKQETIDFPDSEDEGMREWFFFNCVSSFVQLKRALSTKIFAALLVCLLCASSGFAQRRDSVNTNLHTTQPKISSSSSVKNKSNPPSHSVSGQSQKNQQSDTSAQLDSPDKYLFRIGNNWYYSSNKFPFIKRRLYPNGKENFW